MLKLKPHYFGHLMWTADSLEKSLMLERLRAEGEEGARGWDGWVASPRQWTWIWANSERWWGTGRSGVAAVHGFAELDDSVTEEQHPSLRASLGLRLPCRLPCRLQTACNLADLGLISELGRFFGEGNGYPLQYSCLENSMDREALQASVHGVAKSWTRLSDKHRHTHTHTHTHTHPSLNVPVFKLWGWIFYLHIILRQTHVFSKFSWF